MVNGKQVAVAGLLAAMLAGCETGAGVEAEGSASEGPVAEKRWTRPIVVNDLRKPAGVPAEFVATPVGYFHPSCLVHVDGNQGLVGKSAPACAHPHYDRGGRRAPASDGERAPSTDMTPQAAGVVPAPLTNDIEGWSLADHSSYTPGIARLTSTWKVPPTPPQAGQVLYFFPGSQSLDGKAGGTILQPVLAYYNSQWYVQSWNCCEGGGNAQYGDAVTVRPGDTIVGTNVGTNCNPATGICDTWRITTADVTTGGASVFDTYSFGHPHQWIFANVLELYSLTSCAQLPTTGSLTIHGFGIWDLYGNAINVPGLIWHDDVDAQLAGCGVTWGGTQSGTDFTINWGGASLTAGGGTFSVALPFSGKCLDISASGTADGTKVQEWSCNHTGAQQFRVESVGNEAFRLINTRSNKCVDISAAGTADGTPAQLWTCNGTGAQSFWFSDLGNGNVTFVNTNSGKCLDVTSAATGDGTQIQLYTCNGTGAQVWRFEPF